MAEASFSNFFGNQPLFGLTVKGHERTLKQAGQTIKSRSESVLSPIVNFIDNQDNQDVFTGDVAKEINSGYAKCMRIGLMMQNEDVKVNGEKPRFNVSF